MPRLVHSAPKYRLHRASGQAVVTILGKDFYLGPWRSKASKFEYDRLISEWLANGRCLSAGQNKAVTTVTELVAAYWKFAKSYYRKDGRPTGALSGIKVALRILRRRYGDLPANEFGPKSLRALQHVMVELNHSRGYINSNIDRIRRAFKWAVSVELAPVSVYQALQTVRGLQKGRTAARDNPPVKPISDETVDATLPHLPAVVADMVRLQRLTGCRPNEVCILRPCDLDTTGDVWSYRPQSHKTEHHGRERIIYLGQKAQAIIRPYLLRDASAYCFVPREAEQTRNAERRASRRTPMTPSQAKRRPVVHRLRAPGDRYTATSYRRAINRACDKASPAPNNLSSTETSRDWRKAHRWSPNRLRHTAATEIRRRFGLEAAQVTLGHASADVSQIYAERDNAKAQAVMREVG